MSKNRRDAWITLAFIVGTIVCIVGVNLCALGSDGGPVVFTP